MQFQRMMIIDQKKINRRWTRILAVGILIAILFFSFSMIRAYAVNDSADEYSKQTIEASERSIVVVSGDSLWRIAEAYKPAGESVQKFIDKIKKLNKMRSSVLYEGELLYLP